MGLNPGMDHVIEVLVGTPTTDDKTTPPTLRVVQLSRPEPVAVTVYPPAVTPPKGEILEISGQVKLFLPGIFEI